MTIHLLIQPCCYLCNICDHLAVAMGVVLLLGTFAYIFWMFIHLSFYSCCYLCNIRDYLAVAMGVVLLLGKFTYIFWMFIQLSINPCCYLCEIHNCLALAMGVVMVARDICIHFKNVYSLAYQKMLFNQKILPFGCC